jgi:hypothetical protein
MVHTSLSTYGVTKHVSQKQGSGELDQYVQLNLGAQNTSRTIVAISEQSSSSGKTKIVTETIGTPETNFVRYQDIQTNDQAAQGKDFSKVLNQWAKDPIDGSSGNSSFAEAIFDVVPFARLTPGQRKTIVQLAQREQVYKVDFGSIVRRQENGREAYEYTVSVNPAKYVTLLKAVDAAMGLNQLKNLDAKQYEKAAPVQAKLTVDVLSRQLLKISFEGGAREEKLSAYGVTANIQAPSKTIPREELENLLKTILSPGA